MKYILLFFVGIIGFSCGDKKKSIDKSNGDNLITGKLYTICGSSWEADKDNPFNQEQDHIATVATVIIEAKEKGYVKYCWSHEINIPGHIYFSRTYDEFIDLMNACDAK